MRKYLENFFTLCEYPPEAAASLLADYDKLMECSSTRSVFEKYISAYEKAEKGKINFSEMLDSVRAVTADAGVHTYAAELLIYCCLSRHLRELYQENGIDDGVWRDSMLDLRYKLMECYDMHGIWGSFVAFWFDLFFCLDRFALGRLQYEHSSYFATNEPYTKFGLELIRDKSRALQLHIPSSGKLTEESVIDSLKKAYGFFKDTEYVQNGILITECSSWLLFGDMEKFLRPESNVMKFQRCFELTASWGDAGFHDCWRLYNRDWDGNADALPRDTDMQRRFADWLKAGNSAGCGLGLLLFDGEKIINI